MCSGPALGLVVGLAIVSAILHMAGWRDVSHDSHPPLTHRPVSLYTVATTPIAVNQ